MPHECTNCGRRFENGSKQMLSGCPNCGGNKFQFQPGGRDTDAAEKPSVGDDVASSDATASGDAVGDAASDDGVPEANVEREMPELAKEPKHEIVEQDPDQATFDEMFRDAEIDEEVGEENTAQNTARSSAATIDEINEARRKMVEAEEDRLSDVETDAGGTPVDADTGGTSPTDSARGTTQGPPTEPPSGEESAAFDVSGAVGPDDVDPVEKQPVGGSTGEPAAPATEEDTDLGALRDELNDQFESIKITAPGQYELNLMELFDRKEYIISLQEDGRYVIEMADDYGVEKD